MPRGIATLPQSTSERLSASASCHQLNRLESISSVPSILPLVWHWHPSWSAFVSVRGHLQGRQDLLRVLRPNGRCWTDNPGASEAEVLPHRPCAFPSQPILFHAGHRGLPWAVGRRLVTHSFTARSTTQQRMEILWLWFSDFTFMASTGQNDGKVTTLRTFSSSELWNFSRPVEHVVGGHAYHREPAWD